MNKNDEGDVKYEDEKTVGWRLGRIQGMMDDTLTIILPNLGVVMRLDRWSSFIAKSGSHSRQDQLWRSRWLKDTSNNGFKQIDCHDGNKW